MKELHLSHNRIDFRGALQLIRSVGKREDYATRGRETAVIFFWGEELCFVSSFWAGLSDGFVVADPRVEFLPFSLVRDKCLFLDMAYLFDVDG